MAKLTPLTLNIKLTPIGPPAAWYCRRCRQARHEYVDMVIIHHGGCLGEIEPLYTKEAIEALRFEAE